MYVASAQILFLKDFFWLFIVLFIAFKNLQICYWKIEKASVTGNFHPKMLLIDVSIEGPKNMWRVALQMPGPQ